jgi:hypothetical protein
LLKPFEYRARYEEMAAMLSSITYVQRQARREYEAWWASEHDYAKCIYIAALQWACAQAGTRAVYNKETIQQLVIRTFISDYIKFGPTHVPEDDDGKGKGAANAFGPWKPSVNQISYEEWKKAGFTYETFPDAIVAITMHSEVRNLLCRILALSPGRDRGRPATYAGKAGSSAERMRRLRAKKSKALATHKRGHPEAVNPMPLDSAASGIITYKESQPMSADILEFKGRKVLPDISKPPVTIPVDTVLRMLDALADDIRDAARGDRVSTFATGAK